MYIYIRDPPDPPTRWCPPRCITPIKYRYIYHQCEFLELCSPTSPPTAMALPSDEWD